MRNFFSFSPIAPIALMANSFTCIVLCRERERERERGGEGGGVIHGRQVKREPERASPSELANTAPALALQERERERGGEGVG